MEFFYCFGYVLCADATPYYSISIYKNITETYISRAIILNQNGKPLFFLFAMDVLCFAKDMAGRIGSITKK